MKVFKIFSMALFAIIMSVGFIACSSDDDNEESGKITKIVVGKWKVEYIYPKYHYDTNGNYVEDSIDENTFDTNDTNTKNVDLYFTFNTDGTGYYVEKNDGSKSDFTYEFIEGVLYVYRGTSSYAWRYKIVKNSKNVLYMKRIESGTYAKLVRM